ncbi:hypothetical protein LCGC14_0788570 [marine sediment metagenome]|uniref:Uncharacterized protein n=1 Tax=marine sediment metagenome TaxID=412755 RepID=A0A0F9SD43_9ZZZZ
MKIYWLECMIVIGIIALIYLIITNSITIY